jgi:CRISPR-associated protein Csb2
MQALVAAGKSGGVRKSWESVQEALRWLERQPSPVMRAASSTVLKSYQLAVPNNDSDSVARDWLAGKWNDGSSIRTMKSIQPRLISDEFPHVEYEWPVDEEEQAHLFAEKIRPAVNSLYCLGWGVDMACADVQVLERRAERAGWKSWIPDSHGETYNVPAPGFLDDLESTFERYTKRSSGLGVDTNTRPTAYREQRYRKASATRAPFATFGLRTLDGEDIFSRPWPWLIKIGAWMRHSAGSLLQGTVDDHVLRTQIYGHGENAAEANERMSYVPLPSLHRDHGDARIRRVMICQPRGSDGKLVRELSLRWRGVSLRSEEKEECIPCAQNDGVTKLYVGETANWQSVTPVILHGHNANRGVISIPKTEKLLLQAFTMAGLPPETISSLAFQPASFWPGCGAASRIRVPKHLEGFPRYHVEVQFNEPVEGPVLAGIGRHYGLGVFAMKE